MASTLFPRTRLYCTDCDEIVGTLRITSLICSRKLGGFGCAFAFWGTQKPSPEGKVPTNVGGRGIAAAFSDRGTNQDSAKSHLFFLFRQHKCCHLPHGGRSCQAYLKGSTITTAVGWLRKIFYLSGHLHPKGTSYGDAEASPSGRSTQRQGDKRSAAADLIASNAPLRGGRHKARQNGPKHYPGDSRGRSPLARLSPLSFVVQRKMESPKGVG